LDGTVKSKVLIALALFLHLLVHPLLHAADMQTIVATGQPSFSKAALVAPATPECAVCHMAGHAQVSRLSTILFVGFDPQALVTAVPEFSPSEPVDTHIPPRAPPVL
jgi:hypothetical protein